MPGLPPLVAAGLLLALSLATRYGAYRVELARLDPAQMDAAKAVMRLFDVNRESNVPTLSLDEIAVLHERLGGVVVLYALMGLLRLRPVPAGGYAVSLYSGTCRPPSPAN